MGQGDEAVQSLDEEALLRVARELVARGQGATCQVGFGELLDALLAGRCYASPAEAWRARLALRRRVIALIEGIVGLTYVEGDA